LTVKCEKCEDKTEYGAIIDYWIFKDGSEHDLCPKCYHEITEEED
jgi:hypothetical protein